MKIGRGVTLDCLSKPSASVKFHYTNWPNYRIYPIGCSIIGVATPRYHPYLRCPFDLEPPPYRTNLFLLCIGERWDT